MPKKSAIKISVIIPCYNVENKIQKCIQSLEAIKFPKKDYEIIFVDDYSSDETVKIIGSTIKNHKNWYLHTLDKNSGSPSKPRNVGTSLAKGEYMFFLDSDDEIINTSLQKQYTLAKRDKACIVRGKLIVDNNGNRVIANQINGFPHDASKQEKIKVFISTQSTTAPSLIKKSLLTENTINWEEDIHLGEDTLFLIDVFNSAVNISYIDEALFIYNKTVQNEASATQTYGARELKNHLYVWSEAEKRLSKFGFSYFKIRGQVALQTTFQGILTYYYQNDINRKLFEKFSSFINRHWETASKFTFRARFKRALQHLQTNNYPAFFQTLKPQILIASDDLYEYLIDAIPRDSCKQSNSLKLIKNTIEKGIKPKKILDFGCGTGDTSGFFNSVLPDTDWFGITHLSSPEIKNDKNTRTSNNLIYDGSTLPYESEYFDLIYSNQVLEYIPDPEKALSEIARTLAKDGLFIGQTSQYEPCHSFSYWNISVYSFKRMVENVGMKLIELRPGIDCFSLMKRSYTLDFDKYNKYFNVESPVNIDIEQVAQEKQQSNATINYRKLMYSGQFSFICTLR